MGEINEFSLAHKFEPFTPKELETATTDELAKRGYSLHSPEMEAAIARKLGHTAAAKKEDPIENPDLVVEEEGTTVEESKEEEEPTLLEDGESTLSAEEEALLLKAGELLKQKSLLEKEIIDIEKNAKGKSKLEEARAQIDRMLNPSKTEDEPEKENKMKEDFDLKKMDKAELHEEVANIISGNLVAKFESLGFKYSSFNLAETKTGFKVEINLAGGMLKGNPKYIFDLESKHGKILVLNPKIDGNIIGRRSMSQNDSDYITTVFGDKMSEWKNKNMEEEEDVENLPIPKDEVEVESENIIKQSLTGRLESLGFKYKESNIQKTDTGFKVEINLAGSLMKGNPKFIFDVESSGGNIIVINPRIEGTMNARRAITQSDADFITTTFGIKLTDFVKSKNENELRRIDIENGVINASYKVEPKENGTEKKPKKKADPELAKKKRMLTKVKKDLDLLQKKMNGEETKKTKEKKSSPEKDILKEIQKNILKIEADYEKNRKELFDQLNNKE